MNWGDASSGVVHVIAGYFAFTAVTGLVLALWTRMRTLRERRSNRVLEEIRRRAPRRAPPLSLAVLPDGHDENTCRTVASLLACNLPDVEIIIVSDGLRGTLNRTLEATFGLQKTARVYRHEVAHAKIRAVHASKTYPTLLLVDKEEVGSADALNAAINVSHHPLFGHVTAGMQLDPQMLCRMLEEYVDAPPSLAAVVSPTNVLSSGFGDVVAEVARLEFMMPPGRGWASIAAATSASMPFVVFRKRSLELLGGFGGRARPQGIDMCFRLVDELRRWGTMGRITLVSEPAAWETGTAGVRRLRRAQAALVEAVFRHGLRMFRRGPASARAALAYLGLVEILTPLAEVASWVLLPLCYLAGGVGLDTVAAGAALLIGGPFLRSAVNAVTELSNRERHPDAAEALRTLFGVLLSLLPVGPHQVGTWARAFAALDAVRSMSDRSRRTRHRPQMTQTGFEMRPGLVAAPPASYTERRRAPEAPIAPAAPRPLPPVRPFGTTPMPPPLRWAAPLLRPAAPPPAAPPAPAPTTAVAAPPPPPIQTPSVPPIPQPATGLAVPAPPPLTAKQGGPITFDVVTHYQIRADVPAGSMPALQLPSASGGPIIMTTGAGQTAVPPTPQIQAPQGGAPAAPPPGAPPQAPAPGGHRASMRRAKRPEPPPAGPEKPRALPPIPDLPAGPEAPPAQRPPSRDSIIDAEFRNLDRPPTQAPPPPAPSAPPPARPEVADQPPQAVPAITALAPSPEAPPSPPAELLLPAAPPVVESRAVETPVEPMREGVAEVLAAPPAPETAPPIAVPRLLAPAEEIAPKKDTGTWVEDITRFARTAPAAEPLDLSGSGTDVVPRPAPAPPPAAAEPPPATAAPAAEPEEAPAPEAATEKDDDTKANSATWIEDIRALLKDLPASDPIDLSEAHVERVEAEEETLEEMPQNAAAPASSEPLDLSEIEARVVDEPAEPSSEDSAPALPDIAGKTSEPLDLDVVDEQIEDETVGDDTTLLHLDTEDEEDDGALSNPTTALPDVPDQIASEPLDLGSTGFPSTADAPAAGVPMEPIEPSNINRYMQSLSQSPIFSGMYQSQRNRVIQFVRSATVGSGQNVLTEGQPGVGLFLIMRGSFDVLQATEQGEERKIATLGPGDCFGEMSLLTGEPASATVRAAEDGELLVIPKDHFAAITEILPWIGGTLARLIAQRLARTSATVTEELRKGLFGRLELIPPSAIAQAISTNAQSGLLVVQSGRESFTGYFQDGQLLDAQTEELYAEDAFYELLTWTSGSFRFEPKRREDAPRIVQTDTVALLLEGLRRIDENRRQSGRTEAPVDLVRQTQRRLVAPMAPFSLSDHVSAGRALERLSLFAGLEHDQIRSVIAVMQQQSSVPGDLIIRQGQMGQALYIVADGTFDVVRSNSEGIEEKLASLHIGDCFGEISLITGEPATANVRSAEAGLLLTIPRQDVFQLLGRIPSLGASLARILASRLAKASRWLREQTDDAIAGRLETMQPMELIQAINVNRQSGILTVQCEDKTADLEILDGEILDVRLADLRGDEAFFLFLSWKKGTFRLKPVRPSHSNRVVSGDTMGLLFRGMRRIERVTYLVDEIAPKRATEPAPAAAAAAPGAPDAEPAPEHPMEFAPIDLKVVELEPLDPSDIRRGLETLAQSAAFCGAQPADRSRIVPYLRTARVEVGETVLLEGHPGRGLFVVMNGTFEVAQKGAAPEEKRVATLGPGECFGEISMLTGEVASASVRGVTEGRLLAIPRESFPELIRAMPWLGLTLARLLAERLLKTSDDLRDELNKGLIGQLELVHAVALVQAINVNAQTGTLTVVGHDSRFVGYFQDGQLYEAQTGPVYGADALYALAGWTSGTFRFVQERREDAVRHITQDTVGLLLEAMRRADEERHHGNTTRKELIKEREAKARAAAHDSLPSLNDERAAIEALGRLTLFSGLRADQVQDVLNIMVERRIAAGDGVVRQGHMGHALFLIASGHFDVTQRDATGATSTLATLAPGECFGEIALVTGAPAEATVTAKEEGRLFMIPREDLLRLIGKLPVIGASLARILASRLARASRWIQEQIEKGIFGRLESMPATELVQALHVNAQTGLLVIQSDNKTVELVFLDGEVQDARAEDQRGDEAFFKMLHWTSGAFRFEPGLPPYERTVQSDTVGLLFRGLRRLERSRQRADAQEDGGLRRTKKGKATGKRPVTGKREAESGPSPDKA